MKLNISSSPKTIIYSLNRIIFSLKDKKKKNTRIESLLSHGTSHEVNKMSKKRTRNILVVISHIFFNKQSKSHCYLFIHRWRRSRRKKELSTNKLTYSVNIPLIKQIKYLLRFSYGDV